MEQTGALRVMDAPAPMTVTPQAATPAFLLQLAVQQGADLDRLERLMALQERWEANEARKAFNSAFAAFKSAGVRIIKNKTVESGPMKGMKHADLFAVVDALTPELSAHGLSASWKLTKDDRDWLEVTCVLRHVAGHFEAVAMGGAPDTSGAKNSIQARASTKSYLERYTFLAITGMASTDQDDDGAGGAAPQANGQGQPGQDPIEAYTGELAELLRESAKVLRATTTDAEALAAWKAKREQFTSVKQAYEAFKKACELHRVALKGGAQ